MTDRIGPTYDESRASRAELQARCVTLLAKFRESVGALEEALVLIDALIAERDDHARRADRAESRLKLLAMHRNGRSSR